MNKRLLLLTLILMAFNNGFAQKAYFQQAVNYKINVSLDDKKHKLAGDISIEYTNNAPEELPFIYFNLWMNAFGSRKSAYAKQQSRFGNSEFYFAEDRNLGGYSDFDFKVNDKKCELEFDKSNPDIAKIILPKPLKTGEKIVISTPFSLKIPYAFSRGGHLKQQYLMTQWFPKPAVYDATGWHAMPYLDIGEFYSEFGSFDVNISLPENYVVGATGVLATASEVDFLNKKAQNTEGVTQPISAENDSFPPSSTTTKTLHYTAENVHDFAWFADKRFNVAKSEVILKSGKKVDTYAFFTKNEGKNWSKATDYINRAVQFYSENVGEYPYPQASAVQSFVEKSDGMEYPMITLISGSYDAKNLDLVITHEVGHNWFYGILASNERDFAWMDEGMNSYYEHRYTEQLYPNSDVVDLPKFLTKGSDYNLTELALQRESFERKDQAPQTTADKMSFLNYFLGVYEKAAKSLKILEKYYGTERYDGIMKSYFEAWKFKHPQPADFRKHWEQATGEKLDWFFNGLIESTKQLDYAIKSVENKGNDWVLTVENKGEMAVPFAVKSLKDGKEVAQKWFAGVVGRTDLTFPKGDFDALILDAEHLLPDINRGNNSAQLTGNGTTRQPVRLKFLLGIDNAQKTNIYWTPALAANKYDGLMLGLALHSGFAPTKNWEWAIAPMFGTNSGALTGVADVNYSFFSGKNKITLGVAGKRFSFDDNALFKTQKQYTKITPSVSFTFGQNPLSSATQTLEFRHILLNNQDLAFDTSGRFTGKIGEWANISELSYYGKFNQNATFRAALENQSYSNGTEKLGYTKLSFELKNAFEYQHLKKISVRFFAGGFLSNSGKESGSFFGTRSRGSLGLVGHGSNDYRYDGLFVGRNDEKGLFSQQIDPNTEGGMKFNLPEGSGTEVGFSNSFVASMNLKLDLPVDLPKFFRIKPYLDFGYFDDKRPESLRSTDLLLISGGLAWELGDYFGIYVPIYFSGSADDPNSFKSLVNRRGDFLSRVTFNLNLNQLNVLKIIKNLGF